jgi:hypothetical protein
MFGMNPDGWYYSYFPMPFSSAATLAIRNDSSLPITNLSYEVRYRPEAYPGLGTAAGYFHATAHEEIPTTTGEDFTALSETGQGHIVGTVLFLRSRTDKPGMLIRTHLEGDERIHVDGSASPAIYGTGTEDYLNAGWYFRRGVFSLPTHGVPLLFFPPEGSTVLDESGSYRLHLTDAISFRSSVRFGLEHGDPVLSQVGTNTKNGDYRSLVFWYGLPDAAMGPPDTLDVGDTTSETAHGFAVDGPDKLLSSTYYYEGDDDDVAVPDDGRVGMAPASFTVGLDAADRGVLLRRRSDQGIRNQRARVLVDGVNIGTWYNPGRNTSKRWLDSDFLIPPALTVGKPSLHIRLEPEGEAVWTAYTYEAYSLVGPAVAVPKIAGADTDADGLTNDIDVDDDNDGCPDTRELSFEPRLGGGRNPHDFWDFFDTPDMANARDHAVSVADIGRIVQRFGSSGSGTTVAEALAPPPSPPAYHAGFDRASPTKSQTPWAAGPANGSVTVVDISVAVAQFGHSCL